MIARPDPKVPVVAANQKSNWNGRHSIFGYERFE
jgi:hypothetical protein